MWTIIKSILISNMFGTVISGVLVFIASQLFIEYFLKPIQEYKKLRSKIAYELTLYANLYMNPSSDPKLIDSEYKASIELRKLAAEVDAEIELRPRFNFLIAKRKTLAEVSQNLIGLSNGFYSPHPDFLLRDNEQRTNKIYSILNLHSKEK